MPENNYSSVEGTPPRILLIYVHPDPDASVANKAILSQVKDLPNVTFHDLYAHYPDFFINVKHEHELLLSHDIIVFQHPLYMYSCPALLKEWLDRVLGKGFAFGKGCALKDKYWRSVITAGGAKKAFGASGYNRYPMEEILQPFELTAALCQMHWIEPLVLYWARHASTAELQEHARLYRQWMLNPLDDGRADCTTDAKGSQQAKNSPEVENGNDR
ncbi:glutathione-regulated potassium-efflux system ancillary protein KefG [Vibrio albus]|uniref:Glutathione-regulated potassium-efflux system ancillary protein KefG n=1 Tax=Vibrio albus TaxID=2200953 RepID=A0A2U3BAH4_9VIBR|nr:glutathione-regulated potassium-efflux system ancillary protein KefG [Vibrio albus]PWI33788.1 glutathione-regulated potassium-efflux system ancillary protein KefG [Vibrio albus]